MHQKDIATLKIVERAMIFFIIVLAMLGFITRDSDIVYFALGVSVLLVIVWFFTSPIPQTQSEGNKEKVVKKPATQKGERGEDDIGHHEAKQKATEILHARFEEKEGSKN